MKIVTKERAKPTRQRMTRAKKPIGIFLTPTDGKDEEFFIPNAETLEAVRELRAGEGVRYKDAFEMFAELGIAIK